MRGGQLGWGAALGEEGCLGPTTAGGIGGGTRPPTMMFPKRVPFGSKCVVILVSAGAEGLGKGQLGKAEGRWHSGAASPPPPLPLRPQEAPDRVSALWGLLLRWGRGPSSHRRWNPTKWAGEWRPGVRQREGGTQTEHTRKWLGRGLLVQSMGRGGRRGSVGGSEHDGRGRGPFPPLWTPPRAMRWFRSRSLGCRWKR